VVESPDPVSIEIAPGRSFHLRGSIDRVDEALDGTFEVWDYKTGSSRSIREGLGVRGGRQVQPALYAMALEILLQRVGRTGKVSRSGYFFPGRKGEGQRMIVPVDRGETRDVLGKLFDLLARGMFPHALSVDSCKFCDFEAICGGKKMASERAAEKLAVHGDPVLAAFRDLNAEETD
jgi:CRISPR/Cas system-associated exonuclease Cas4 (RecB family)